MDEERLAVAGLGPTYPRWGYEPSDDGKLRRFCSPFCRRARVLDRQTSRAGSAPSQILAYPQQPRRRIILMVGELRRVSSLAR